MNRNYENSKYSIKPYSWLPGIVCLFCMINTVRGEPIITVDSYMDIFTAEAGKSETNSYMVYGTGFPAESPPVTIEMSDPSGAFTISTSSGSGYGTTIVITEIFDGYFEAMIWVKFAPDQTGSHTGTISHTSDVSTTQTLTVEGNATSLPVHLLHFKVERDNEKVLLEWGTASENNHSHFEVEVKKGSSGNFQKIGSLNSALSSTSNVKAYHFDYTPEGTAGNYYFRLKQIDMDQNFEYSPVIMLAIPVTLGLTTYIGANRLSFFPKLNISTAQSGILKVVLLNNLGTMIFSNSYTIEIDGAQPELTLGAQIPSGHYVIIATFKSSDHPVFNGKSKLSVIVR